MSESVQERPQRRILIIVAVVLAVVVAVGTAFVLWDGRDGQDPGAVAASSSPVSGTSTEPTAEQDGSPGPTSGTDDASEPAPSESDGSTAAGGGADEGADGAQGDTEDDGGTGDGTTYTAEELPPVAPDETAEGSDGVTAELRKIEQVTGEAVASGEVGGPAVRLTVRLTNGTDEPIELGYVAVNAYVGPDRVPASTFVKPGAKPFKGTLAPGESGSGVVLFGLTEEQGQDVTVTVDYGADVPVLAFQGALEG
jgi:hypothetical protein